MLSAGGGIEPFPTILLRVSGKDLQEKQMKSMEYLTFSQGGPAACESRDLQDERNETDGRRDDQEPERRPPAESLRESTSNHRSESGPEQRADLKVGDERASLVWLRDVGDHARA